MRRIISMLIIVLICYSAVLLVRNNSINDQIYNEIIKQEFNNETVITENLEKLDKAKEGKQDKIKELESIEQCNQEIQSYIQ